MSEGTHPPIKHSRTSELTNQRAEQDHVTTERTNESAEEWSRDEFRGE